MATRRKILIAAAFLLLIGYIIYSSTGLAQVSCEVCMDFKGRKACNRAAGLTRDEAQTTAKRASCSDVASGRDESIACNDLSQPQSVICK